MTENDVAVVICNTCQAICLEDSEARVMSIWELLQDDDEFPFPDFAGEHITLQDCWRARDRTAQHNAVRAIMRRMNIHIVELEENRGATRFCGTSLYEALPEANGKFAPKRFIEEAGGMFTPHSKTGQKRLMVEHCEKIETEKVACYCVPCTKGIRIGGKHGMHLADMLLGLDG